jgi:hypothetical protein
MLSLSGFEQMCHACCVSDRKRALAFLTGDTLLYYPRIPALCDWLFCDASWLVDVMSRALSIRDGSAAEQQLDILFPRNLLGIESSLVMHVLSCFALMHPVRVASSSGDLATRFCVPSQLPAAEPLQAVVALSAFVDRANTPTVRRIYRFNVVPVRKNKKEEQKREDSKILLLLLFFSLL